DVAQFYCYAISQLETQRFESGRARLAIGRLQVNSAITGDSGTFCYCVLHFGDQNVSAGVCPDLDASAFAALVALLSEPLEQANLVHTIREMDKYFGDSMISTSSLFHAEQMKILNQALSASVAEPEQAYQSIYENNAP